jgi:hypothetical protein
MYINYIITGPKDVRDNCHLIYELNDGRIAQARFGGWRDANNNPCTEAVGFDVVEAIGYNRGEWDPDAYREAFILNEG